MSELRQRKQPQAAGETGKPGNLDLALAPIQELEPDYAISVKYTLRDAKLKKDLEILLNQLYSSGFFVQVRPRSSDGGLLLFAKLGSAKYNELKANDEMVNFEFDVLPGLIQSDSRPRLVGQYLSSITAESLIVEGIVPLYNEVSTASSETLEKKYGSQVAIYFEFFASYLTYLASLSLVGAYYYITSKPKFLMSYSLINLVIGIIFLSSWRKLEATNAKVWGTYNVLKIELNQSSDIEKPSSDVTRFKKQLGFIPIALGFTAVLVAFQLGCFVIEIFLSEIYDGPLKSVITLIPTILILVFVPILTIVYNLVADKYIAFENHQSTATKKTSSLIKNFALNFLTGYNPLLITSFIYLPFAHLIKPHLTDIKSQITGRLSEGSYLQYYLSITKRQEEFEFNQERLNVQFSYFIITNQVVQLVLKYVLPLVIRFSIQFVNEKILKKNEKSKPLVDKPDETVFLNAVRKQASLPVYNVNDDFRGLVLQYGYLIMFGTIWLLAPLVLLIFASITYFADKKKLESKIYFRNVIPARVDSILPWNQALFGLTWIGSVVSPAITAFYRHGTRPPVSIGKLAFDKASVHSSSLNVFFYVFVAEHIFLISSFIMQRIDGLSLKRNKDVILRRDIYKKKLEVASYSANVSDQDNVWAAFDESSALADAEWRGVISEGGPSRPVSHTIEEQKEKILKVKSNSDSYIEKDGKVSIIDDNSHFQPPVEDEQDSVEKDTGSSSYEHVVNEAFETGKKIDVEAQTKAESFTAKVQKNAETIAEVAQQKAESFVEEVKSKGAPVDAKIERKKSGIKKIFGKKK